MDIDEHIEQSRIEDLRATVARSFKELPQIDKLQMMEHLRVLLFAEIGGEIRGVRDDA